VVDLRKSQARETNLILEIFDEDNIKNEVIGNLKFPLTEIIALFEKPIVQDYEILNM
jgi:hypothetical protein